MIHDLKNWCFSDRDNISLSLFCIICLHFLITMRFCFIFLQKINLIFILSFLCSCIFFHLIELCVILYLIFFVINLLWWFLHEETFEGRNFLFGSLPCILQWNNYHYSAVPTIEESLHSLRQLLMISVWQIFGYTLKKEFL